MTPRNTQRRAYVLITVLALLVLSATLLVTVAQVAFRHAVAANAAAEDLQSRAAIASARKALLPRIDSHLTAAEARTRRPVPRLGVSIKLGNQSVDLILADEQAKANVNAILEEADLSRTQMRLGQSLAGTGLAASVKIRPTQGAVIRLSDPVTTAPTTQPAISGRSPMVGSYAGLFDRTGPADLLRPMPGNPLAPVDLVTLWGNGAINVRRVPTSALQLAAGRALTGVEMTRLIEARDAVMSGRTSLLDSASAGERMAGALKSATAQAVKARSALGFAESSKCHSLWIVTRTRERRWYDLAVLDQSNARQPRIWTFSWH